MCPAPLCSTGIVAIRSQLGTKPPFRPILRIHISANSGGTNHSELGAKAAVCNPVQKNLVRPTLMGRDQLLGHTANCQASGTQYISPVPLVFQVRNKNRGPCRGSGCQCRLLSADGSQQHTRASCRPTQATSVAPLSAPGTRDELRSFLSARAETQSLELGLCRSPQEDIHLLSMVCTMHCYGHTTTSPPRNHQRWSQSCSGREPPSQCRGRSWRES
jgi:hypothetical protein